MTHSQGTSTGNSGVVPSIYSHSLHLGLFAKAVRKENENNAILIYRGLRELNFNIKCYLIIVIIGTHSTFKGSELLI